MVKEAGCTGLLQLFQPAPVLKIHFTHQRIKSAHKSNKFLTKYITRFFYTN